MTYILPSALICYLKTPGLSVQAKGSDCWSGLVRMLTVPTQKSTPDPEGGGAGRTRNMYGTVQGSSIRT